MPQRVEKFLSGTNVNVMAYGQTGSGKTHTIFGPPGIMARAGSGELGPGTHAAYGICPRGILDIMRRVEELRRASADKRYVLVASAVELSIAGNIDLLSKAAAMLREQHNQFAERLQMTVGETQNDQSRNV